MDHKAPVADPQASRRRTKRPRQEEEEDMENPPLCQYKRHEPWFYFKQPPSEEEEDPEKPPLCQYKRHEPWFHFGLHPHTHRPQPRLTHTGGGATPQRCFSTPLMIPCTSCPGGCRRKSFFRVFICALTSHSSASIYKKSMDPSTPPRAPVPDAKKTPPTPRPTPRGRRPLPPDELAKVVCILLPLLLSEDVE